MILTFLIIIDAHVKYHKAGKGVSYESASKDRNLYAGMARFFFEWVCLSGVSLYVHYIVLDFWP